MYFEKFPTFFYDFEIDSKKERVTYAITDITRNIRFRRDVLANITVFDSYIISNGETPEMLAEKFYGDPNYHWVIMLANQRYDYRADWLLDTNTLEKYVVEKYTNPYGIHHYEADNLVVSSDYPNAQPVTNFEYEDKINESKRVIKIVSPELLDVVLRNFDEMM
jgi:hypothetical protein